MIIIRYVFLIYFLSMMNYCQLRGNSATNATSLILVDESIGQVSYIIERLTGKPVLCDQNMPNAKISLNIVDKMPIEDVIRALESVLSLNGIAIIDRGDGFLRMVSTRSVVNHAPELIEGEAALLPVSDKVYAKLFVLKHILVVDFAKLVRQILSSNSATVIPFEESNSLLITDKLSNLQRLEVLIKLVDKPKISKIESKIFRIKHGDAKNISAVLNKLISEKILDTTVDRQTDMLPLGLNQNIPVNALSNKDEAISADSFKLSHDVSIECDEYSNSVIVCGKKQDIQQIGRIIDELDVLLDQVRIEVVIAQVTLSNSETSGLETLGISYNSVTGTDGSVGLSGTHQVQFDGSGASSNWVEKGFNIDGTLNNFSLSYVFNKAKSCDNVSLLSAPTIVTTHNREASVKIGEARPVITANLSSLQNEQSIRNSINYKDIGIELVVTPLIGKNGIIQMKIDQLVQKINGEITVDGNKQPIISKRQAVSFISVHDGDAIVLAGLQEKEYVDSKGKIWLLGYLPVVGDLLFSPKVKFEQTNELIIFIRPTIVSISASNDEYYQKFISNAGVKDDIIYYEHNKRFLKNQGEVKKPYSRSKLRKFRRPL